MKGCIATIKDFPNMTLEDYIKKVIEPIKNRRKMSNVGYGLINFISNSHIFYSFCIGNLSKEQLNEYLKKNCNILKQLEADWNLLKEALAQENIYSIQIFINLIFKDLVGLIKKYKISKDYKEIENFEIQFDQLISKCSKGYNFLLPIFKKFLLLSVSF